MKFAAKARSNANPREFVTGRMSKRRSREFLAVPQSEEGFETRIQDALVPLTS